MAAPEDGDSAPGGFVGRWSRRKAQARSGQPLPEPPVPAAAPERPAPAAPPRDAAPAPLPISAANQPQAGANLAPRAIENEAMPLTLDDVKALALEGDFKPFVARGVAPEVRNAAFKKLFSDPHFNVMDGLDTYIDDYGKPDPLPASMLKQLASARFLKLVEEEPEAPAVAPAPPDAAPGELQNQELAAQAAPDAAADAPAPAAVGESPTPAQDDAAVAPSPPCNVLPTAAAPTAVAPAPDADPDLRLQPDDAARCRAHRPGPA